MSALKTLLSGRISGNDAKALAQADFKEGLFQKHPYRRGDAHNKHHQTPPHHEPLGSDYI